MRCLQVWHSSRISDPYPEKGHGEDVAGMSPQSAT